VAPLACAANPQAVLGNHNNELTSKQKRFAYALVCETLKFNDALDAVVGGSLPAELLSSGDGELEFLGAKGGERKLPRSLAYVMCYDLLLSGRRKLQGGGYAKKALLKHLPALTTALHELLAASSVQPGKFRISQLCARHWHTSAR
jgi:hypothetical protein